MRIESSAKSSSHARSLWTASISSGTILPKGIDTVFGSAAPDIRSNSRSRRSVVSSDGKTRRSGFDIYLFSWGGTEFGGRVERIASFIERIVPIWTSTLPVRRIESNFHFFRILSIEAGFTSKFDIALIATEVDMMTPLDMLFHRAESPNGRFPPVFQWFSANARRVPLWRPANWHIECNS